eukprot:1667334-Rhodomonas_salina.1
MLERDPGCLRSKSATGSLQSSSDPTSVHSDAFPSFPAELPTPPHPTRPRLGLGSATNSRNIWSSLSLDQGERRQNMLRKTGERVVFALGGTRAVATFRDSGRRRLVKDQNLCQIAHSSSAQQTLGRIGGSLPWEEVEAPEKHHAL